VHERVALVGVGIRSRSRRRRRRPRARSSIRVGFLADTREREGVARV